MNKIMNEKVERLITLYLLIKDRIEGGMHYCLFIDIFIQKKDI